MTIGAFPAQPPVVPGLRVSTLLGRGGHGSVWAATELASGEPVAVKVGHPGSVAAPLASELALLCRIEHPHVVRLLRVVPLPDGASAMVLELAAGGSLAGLVALRGTLTAGEVSTLLVPLAGALEHVHRRGLVHGDIAPGNVLFAVDGRPLLGDLGTARVLGPAGRSGADPDADGPWRTPGFEDPAGPAADPRAADVWGLAAVAWFALTGRPPGAEPGPATDQDTASRAPMLVRLLTECLSVDPMARPEPAELARRAWDAARPEPVQLSAPAGSGPEPIDALFRPFLEEPAVPTWQTGPAEEPAVTRPPVRPVPPIVRSEPIVVGGGWGRAVRSGAGTVLRALAHPIAVGGLALCGLAVAAYATGIVATPADRVAAGPAPVPAAVKDSAAVQIEEELTLALQRIGTARATAFGVGSTEALALADEPGSPAEAADLALLGRLGAAGRQFHDVSYSVSDVDVVGAWSPTGRKVTVTALAGTSGYREVQVAGGTATPRPAQSPRRITVTLVRRVGGDWLLRSIT